MCLRVVRGRKNLDPYHLGREKKDSFQPSQKGSANRHCRAGPLRLAFIEQIRIISLVCHLFDHKEEGGTLILHLLNSLPIILFE